MRPRTSDRPEPDPEAYRSDLEARLEGAESWARKGLPHEQIERAPGDVNRKEAI